MNNFYSPEDFDYLFETNIDSFIIQRKIINNHKIIIIDDFKSGPPEGIAIPDVDKAVTEFYEEKKEFYDYREDKLEDGKGFCVLIRK